MQGDSSSLDTLKDNLLRAVDAEYNVIKADIVLDIICQLEKMEITRDQLQTTRLGREINTIRQKLDTRNKNEKSPELFIEIAQRAKKLLRSWQGLLNTSQTDSSSIPSTNGDTKPRLILKVKFNSSITKRKRDSDFHTTDKRKKTKVIQTPVPLPTPISPVILNETSLPRSKTTQQLFIEMQMTESTILQKKIIDESLNQSIISPSNTILTSGLSLKHPSSNTNWENSSNAGSPISPLSSSSSSSIISTTSWPLSTIIPEHNEQSTKFSSDLASINTVADLVEDHRRRMLIKHDSRELEARPDLLLVPIDQLAFVYEREKVKELNLSSQLKHSSMTIVEKLNQPFDLIALPFIDCPLEFNFTLDELVVQYPTTDM